MLGHERRDSTKFYRMGYLSWHFLQVYITANFLTVISITETKIIKDKNLKLLNQQYTEQLAHILISLVPSSSVR